MRRIETYDGYRDRFREIRVYCVGHAGTGACGNKAPRAIIFAWALKNAPLVKVVAPAALVKSVKEAASEPDPSLWRWMMGLKICLGIFFVLFLFC
ncbi:MAG: hypothetical protein ACLUIQ_06155 [Dialister invisus]